MLTLHAAILGIVEGLTEFLPVSSTFHLILTSKLLGIQQSDFLKMFEVVIQFGAVSSLLFLYTKTLLKDRQLWLLLFTSFLPTAIIGKLFYPLIKGVFFESTTLQLSIFALVGILFLILEYLISTGKLILTKNFSNLTLTSAFLIGIAQATSVVPGVSRSGSVIIAALLLGMTRATSANYAFLLSIPTILAATLFDLYENRLLLASSSSSDLLPLVVGFLAAFFSALFVVKWFIKYVSKNTLRPFVYYRFLLIFILIIFKVGLSH